MLLVSFSAQGGCRPAIVSVFIFITPLLVMAGVLPLIFESNNNANEGVADVKRQFQEKLLNPMVVFAADGKG